MLEHLETYATVSDPILMGGNSNGYLADFYRCHLNIIDVEHVYLTRINHKPQGALASISKEYWQIITWKQSWNDIEGTVFDPHDAHCAFSCPYSFYAHVRFFLRKALKEPGWEHAQGLTDPTRRIIAFLKLPGLDTAMILIGGNPYTKVGWSIDITTWQGHPYVWRARDRVLIPAVKE